MTSRSSDTEENEDHLSIPTITAAVDVKVQEDLRRSEDVPDADHPGEESLYIKRDIEKPTTDNETLVHILKGNVGTGILAMPQAFKNAGLWVGFFGIPIMGIICMDCMFTLLRCSKELCRRANVRAMNYEETAKAAFEYGPLGCRKYANIIDYIVTIFLTTTQLGFCCVYFVFITQNLQQAIDNITPSGLSEMEFMTILIVPILLVCYVPHLKYLAPLSLVATIFECLGLVITLYYSVRDLPQVHEDVPAFNTFATLPLYFSSAIFAFEGIGLVLPLENKMKTPQNFGGLTGVLSTAMVVVICLYACVGFFGYLQYGSTVQGSITLNLPPKEPLAIAVKFAMALAVFLTYPLQMYVAYQIMAPPVRRRFQSKRNKFIAEYFCRSLLVLLTFGLAAAIPNIGLFISLVGAVSSSALAIVFPPLIDIVTFWPDKGKYNWRIIKCGLISLIGFLGFVTGTFTSVQAIIQFFKERH